MGNLVAAAMLAAQMEEVRAQMRLLLDTDYEAKMREYADFVRTAQQRLGMDNEFATVLELDRELKAKGKGGAVTVMLMTAAAVELTEGAPFLKGAAI